MATTGAVAETVVYDHFDDAVLNPAWEITFEDASGWTYELASSNLNVTDIAEEVTDTWSHVYLTQDFERLGDFDVLCNFGWDSEGSNAAMQTFMVALRDTNDVYVAWASYHDAWAQSRGEIMAKAGVETWNQGPNSLPHSGQGNLGIQRLGNVVTVSWKGSPVLTGSADTPVNMLELRFSSGEWPSAFFGSFSVDLVSCEGEAWTPAGRSSWSHVKALYGQTSPSR